MHSALFWFGTLVFGSLGTAALCFTIRWVQERLRPAFVFTHKKTGKMLRVWNLYKNMEPFQDCPGELQLWSKYSFRIEKQGMRTQHFLAGNPVPSLIGDEYKLTILKDHSTGNIETFMPIKIVYLYVKPEVE